jgi:hypothetical protein
VFPENFNPGLLVKSIDLPRYSVSLQEMNQYNRKRYIQTKISYDPVKIVFHDDNNNQTRQLWHSYYSYNYYDPNAPFQSGTRYDKNSDDKASGILNQKDIYKNEISQDPSFGYSGDISSSTRSLGLNYKVPFFKSIKIYGFNQHNFALYVLQNPIIESWSHDSYNYYDTKGIMENTMQIKYESVRYYDGAINGEKPDEIVRGFGENSNYDKELSPISRAGSTRSILGQGGLVDSGIGVLEQLNNRDYFSAAVNAARISRTFSNSNQIKNAAANELYLRTTQAVYNPSTARTKFNIPAAGSSTGPGSQSSNATNAANIVAPQVSTKNNNPIK